MILIPYVIGNTLGRHAHLNDFTRYKSMLVTEHVFHFRTYLDSGQPLIDSDSFARTGVHNFGLGRLSSLKLASLANIIIHAKFPVVWLLEDRAQDGVCAGGKLKRFYYGISPRTITANRFIFGSVSCPLHHPRPKYGPIVERHPGTPSLITHWYNRERH